MNLVHRLVGWGDSQVPLGLRWLGWRSRWVETSRGRLHLFEVRGTGAGSPFLLLHGLGSRAADYALLVRRLRPLCSRILIPDLPGHGWSENDRPTADDLHQILTEAVDAILPEPSFVLGNSMGGLVAVRVALRVPERVRGLLLLSPAGAPMAEHQLALVRGHFSIQTNRDIHAFLDKLLGVPSRLRWVLALGLPARLGRPAVRAILEGIREEDFLSPEEVRSLPMPVFFFWGARDRILDAEQLTWYLSHLPAHAVVETPDGFGHSPFLDHPGTFVRAVRRFMDSVGPAVSPPPGPPPGHPPAAGADRG